MKKLLFAVIVLTSSFCCFSQKLQASKVPAVVKEAFKKAHPSATATWEWEDAAYEANFKEAGKTMSCVIDKQGTILETESAIQASELPSGAKTYVDQQFKGRKPKEIARIDKRGGEVEYEVNMGGKDVLFDSKGGRIQKAKEKKD